MMDWITEFSQNLPAWVVSWVSIGASFITAIGLPSIIACAKTYSKAGLYLYNAKKLTEHQNELVAKHNKQNELMINFLVSQIALLEGMAEKEHNPTKKANLLNQIELDKTYLTEFEELKVGNVELATKEQIKQMKKIKIVKGK